jgi:folate-dependent phosphoribosylglycinamide formyltransferase PurN
MLRIAYGCIPSIMSLYFANYLVRRGEMVPACILLSSGGLRFQKKRYTPAQILPLFLRKFGPRFTGYNVIAGLSGSVPLPGSRSGLMSFSRLSKEYGIPLLVSDDFSGEETVSQLKQRGVDLFVTSMCDQILREPLLSTPPHGCLNIHASLLPDFRGVDSVFQAMLHDVPEIGTTLHRTTARIDSGEVLAQCSFPRTATDSHLALTVRSTSAGVRLLREHVRMLERGETPPARTVDPATARFPYRSWPEREELRAFSKRGLAFWRGSDFRRIFRFEDVQEQRAG